MMVQTGARISFFIAAAAFGLLTDWGKFAASLLKAAAALPHLLASLMVVAAFFSVVAVGPYWLFSGKKGGFFFFLGSLFSVSCALWPNSLLLKAVSEQTLSEISFFLFLTLLCSAASGLGVRKAESASQES